MGRTREAKALIRELERRIIISKKRKKRLTDYLDEIKRLKAQGQISEERYLEIINERLDEHKTIEEWIQHYDFYTRDCERKINKYKRKIRKTKLPAVILSFVFIAIILSSIFFFDLSFTGLFVQEQEQEFFQIINLEFSQFDTYEWQLKETGQLLSVKLSGIIEGEGDIKIYLEDLLILDSSNIQSTNQSSNLGRSAITGLTITNEINQSSEVTSNQSYSEEINQEEASQTQEDSSPSQEEPLLTSETINETEIIEEVEENKTEIEESKPAEERVGREVEVREFSNICEETCDLRDLNLNKSSYNLRIEISNAKLRLEKINYEILREIPEEIEPVEEIPLEEATISTTQYQAVLNQPVKWKKTVQLEKQGPVKVKLPKEASNIQVIKVDAQDKEIVSGSRITGQIISGETKGDGFLKRFFKNIFRTLTGRTVDIEEKEEIIEIEIDELATEYEIEYETPAPYAIEEDLENGKRVKLVGPETVHYKDVLAFTNLDESLNIVNPNKIKIKWIENDSYINPSSIEDRDNNGIYDYIEWIAPELSNQTFEIIIITKAEHLDSNRDFISDIYEDVKELDDVWSETIPDEDYVRVTFEAPLDSSRDIALYPRVISGNPKIQVYEIDSDELIAEFTSLTSNQYNKVYLTNLVGEQDTFDLKVLDGEIEIDYIIDAAVRFYLPSSGTIAITPSYDAWDHTSDALRLKAVTTKISSAMTTVSSTNTAKTDGDDLFRQYVSDPIAGQNIASQTIKFQIRAAESSTSANLYTTISVRVVSNDGSTFRSPDILSISRDNTELASSLTNRQFTATTNAVNAQEQDRIVIEIGQGGDPTGGGRHNAGSARIGDNSGSDLPEDDVNTNDYDPWVEFITGFSFYVADDAPTVTLNSPVDYYNSTSPSVTFNCTASDDINLVNVSLYGNWTGWHLNDTNTPANNTPTTFAKTISEGYYTWNCEACDSAAACSFATSNRTFMVDYTAPVVSNEAANETEIALNEVFCLNVTAIDAINGIDTIYAEVWDTSSWANYSMSDTGTSCGGGSDNVYGVEIVGDTEGLWNYSRVYANDSLGNMNDYDFSDLTINVVDYPPFWYSPSVNDSTPDTGDAVRHNVYWTNTDAMSYATLEVNATGANCDTLDNVSDTTLSAQSEWANLTWTIPVACEGKAIGWRQYANDSSNKWNDTGTLQVYSVTNINPNATLGTNPVDTYNTTSQSIIFDLTCADNADVDTLILYGNWTGTWTANKTNSSVINNSVWSIQVDDIPEGTGHVWGVWCNDSAGNSDWSDTNRTFMVDYTAPVVSDEAANETGILVNEVFCLNVTVIDAVNGIDTIYAEVWNTSSWANYSMSDIGTSCGGGSDNVYGVEIVGDTEGLWNYSRVYANDSAGNMNDYDFSDLTILVVDNPPFWQFPSVNDSTPDTSDAVRHNVYWTNADAMNYAILEVNATGTGCDTLGNISNTTLSASSEWANLTWTIPDACEGKAIGWRQYANDSADKWNNTGTLQVYSVTNINPNAILGTNPVDTYNTTSQSIIFDLTCADNADVDTLILYGNWTGTWTANKTNSSVINNSVWSIQVDDIPEGTGHVWGVWCNDSAGNSDWSDTNRTFMVDATAPTVSLISPINNTNSSQSTLNFQFNVTDNFDSSLNCSLFLNSTLQTFNDSTLNATTTTFSSIGVVEGQDQNWTVNCTDAASNSHQPTIRIYNIDLTYPTFTWETPTPDDGDTVNDNFVYLNATITEANDYSAWFDWNKSLVGYWSFDYYNSTGVYDNSSYNNFGVFVGGIGTGDLTTGKRGNALDFDGSSDYVSTSRNGLDTVNFSVSLWVKAAQTDDNSMIYSNTANFNGWGLGMDRAYGACNSGDICVWLGNSDSQGEYVDYPYNFPIGEWVQWVVTFSTINNNLTMYLDGTLVLTESTTYVPEMSGITQSFIGRSTTDWGGYMFNGSIDEVMVFNRILSPQEVSAAYDASANRLENNFTSLEEGTYNYSAYAIDSAGNLNITSPDRQVIISTLDSTVPAVTLISPINNTNSSQSTLNFQFNVIDDFDSSLNCSLFLNSTLQTFNDSTLNATTTTFSSIGVAEGQNQNWTVNCTDAASNSHQPTIRIYNIDLTYPTFTWESPTPDDGDTVNDNFVYLNATITEANDYSAWFDWNKSLVGYWSFDYYNSTGIYDNSSYNNFGTFYGGVGTDNLTTGKRGYGLEFDGDDDEIRISSFNVGNFTVAAWVYPKIMSGTMKVMVGKYFVLEFDKTSGTDTMVCALGTGSGWSPPYAYTPTTYSLNEWHHVVCSYDGTNLIVYLDGIAGTSVVPGTFGDNSNPIRIGRSQSNGYAWNGSIDEVLIFNRSLSPEEINATYNAGLYRLENNFTNLSDGTYNYSAYAIDSAGNLNITSPDRQVTIITDNPPNITAVYNITSNIIDGPNEGPSPTYITINFTAYDLEGFGNLNSDSANVTVGLTGEENRTTFGCTAFTGYDTYYLNYTCNVTMWWWDGAGTWTIYANISDLQANTATNYSKTFTIGETTGLLANSSELSWPDISAAGSINQEANEFLLLNNTGNAQVDVEVNATNLTGETNSDYALGANNFSVHNVAGCEGTVMVASIYTPVIGATIFKGNYTDGTSALEEIYFCLEESNSGLMVQSYSTDLEGSWTIRVFLVAIIPAGRRKKKQKKKKEKTIEDDQLLEALDLIIGKLKEDYPLEKEKLIKAVLEKLNKNYDISRKEFLEIIKAREGISIPISIFTKELGGLEVVSKYMRENLNMSYRDIARELGRDERTIWTAYKKAKEKQKAPIKIKETKIKLPISIFENKELTILESLVVYLKDKKIMKYSEIAEFLERDQRNIWTIYSRAIKKTKQ